MNNKPLEYNVSKKKKELAEAKAELRESKLAHISIFELNELVRPRNGSFLYLLSTIQEGGSYYGKVVHIYKNGGIKVKWYFDDKLDIFETKIMAEYNVHKVGDI